MGRISREWLVDTAERAAFTWLEAFLGLLLVEWSGMVGEVPLGVVRSAAISATIAALTVVKAALASRRPGISPASFVGSSAD